MLKEILYPTITEQIKAQVNPHTVKIAHPLVLNLKANSKAKKTMMARLNTRMGDKAIIGYYSPTRSVVMYCCV
ncbi:hypothetical protein GAPWKB30_1144 [Gilliamella apicola]|nr:hypothetical protein GAPWKB30_1144 [Gilliamella apicola]